MVLGGGLRCAGCVLGAKLLTLVGRGLVGSGVLALTALLACCLCFFWGLALAHKGEAIDFHYLIACDWRGRDRRDCNSEVQMLWSTLVVKQSFCTRSQADVKSVTPFLVVNAPLLCECSSCAGGGGGGGGGNLVGAVLECVVPQPSAVQSK